MFIGQTDENFQQDILVDDVSSDLDKVCSLMYIENVN